MFRRGLISRENTLRFQDVCSKLRVARDSGSENPALSAVPSASAVFGTPKLWQFLLVTRTT
jgi:hypothetical protein